MALTYKGMTLGQQNRAEEGLAVLEEVVRRFGEDDSPSLRGRVEEAILEKADLELDCQRYDAAASTAGRVLDENNTQSLEKRWRGHLIRAKASPAQRQHGPLPERNQGDPRVPPQFAPLPAERFYELMHFSIELGSEPMIEIIQASPSVKLLLPFTTALEQELGRTPRVAKEVAEVARDIRRNLAILRDLHVRGIGVHGQPDGMKEPDGTQD